MRKTNLIALVATFAAGAALAQGMPTTPSTGPSSSSPSSTSPSSGTSAGGSGYLSSPDSASSSAPGGDKFMTLDKDHDGMVSKAESKKDKDLGKQFDTLDSNKDGKLDQAEFSAFETGSMSNQKK
jgi:hypothetical protein